MQELIVEYNRFRISEFPEMEDSRHSLKMCYKELQVSIKFYCSLEKYLL